MAKSTTARSRFKMQRALGLELPGLGKPGALDRRPYGPGVHGNKRKKISDYAIRLKEKQKIVYHYGLREGQLVRFVKAAKKVKDRAWVETLIINLERRLVNSIFRLNFAPSMPAASQMVSHGQVLVNGKKVTRSSMVLEKGDVITLSEKGYKNQSYLRSQESPRMSAVPACWNVEGTEKKTATLAQYPLPEDIPFEFTPQLVIEHYWKVK
ncbi:MAG: 30S ribosomal protein S4 [Halobacteriovoraceae bacterium]|jgi:small subunit ribosomal protein S4|nr:30S ribosomal protein S4 [Halobacteriovoraceae bacterium]MBT5094689.1 30S ribosomal protein S4 [Halobacteriovoraceae bacterium]